MISLNITKSTGETINYPFELTEGSVCRIGRDDSCEISLPEETYLSRVHCIISYANGQLIIQDNQSSNGIFLNEERIISDFLVMNAPYRIGGCTMVVEEQEQPAPQEYAPYAAAPQAYPQQPQAYPQAYPQQPQAYPQAYPQQPQAYPQAYPQQPQAYPQAYPQQPQAYPQAYPQQPQAYPQAYPQQPQAYPQAYPQQPQAYPQAYPQQPQAYPQAYPQQPQAYPQAYPQQPQVYPQAYPQQPEAYSQPEPQAYPQPEPQAYSQPEPAVYAQPEAQAYPQPEPQAYSQPEPELYPQPEAYPAEEESAEEESLPAAAEEAPDVPMEDMLVRDLAEQQKEESQGGGGKWLKKMSDSLVEGKSKFFKLTDRLASLHKGKADAPEAEAPAEESTEPTPAPAPPTDAVEATPAAQAPLPKAPEVSEPATPSPKAPAAAEADSRAAVKVARKKGVKEPEVEEQGMPGNIMNMPYEFGLTLRVTAAAASFVEGASLRFRVRTEQDCRIFLISHCCDGSAELLLPGRKDTDTLVFSSVEGKFPGMGSRNYDLMIEPPFGREIITLLALGSTAKCDFTRELEAYIKAHETEHAGELENGIIAHFREKHAKMADIPWSSAVLHLYTHAKPNGEAS